MQVASEHLHALCFLQAFLVQQEGKVDFVGNRTECALLMMLQRWAIDYKVAREELHPSLYKVCNAMGCMQDTIGCGG